MPKHITIAAANSIAPKNLLIPMMLDINPKASNITKVTNSTFNLDAGSS
ncbi:MAG: hypothetical protein ABJH06_17560 [Paraglaciecola sp.]